MLAVSGGVDSVVMAQMFFLAGYDFSIAHCNFQLRGKESDADEKFVKGLAKEFDVPCYTSKFDTEKYCLQHKVSVQMGARELRYEWLEETRKSNKLDYLVTAHHADDTIETFFINLLRGTGLHGLHGIKEKSGKVIRPLSRFYRSDIEKYAKENELEWREDKSNASDKYERNKIRHHLIPLLVNINPKAKETILNTIENIGKTEFVLNDSVERTIGSFITKEKKRILISLGFFSELNHPEDYLFEMIKSFGFKYDQCLQIKEAVKRQAGKVFLSNSHRILLDRKHLIIEHSPYKSNEIVHEISTGLTELITESGRYHFRTRKRTKSFVIPKEPEIAVLDYDKLRFPLEIRKWKKGDSFHPIGMKGAKKVSDFLIDNKISVFDKEEVTVLISGDEIAWVIGYRPDDRYKVTKATKNLYLCKLEKVSTHE